MMKKIVTIAIITLCSMQYALAEGFSISSPQWQLDGSVDDQQVFNGFGCSGKNMSPEISWKNAPEGTKSYAVTLYDPDAPTGSGWWHWVVFNIPASVDHLVLNAGNIKSNLAPGIAVQSRTDFGTNGFGGPCPPVGDKPHRYHLTVFALKAGSLPLNEDSPAAMVGFYLNQNTLAKVQLTALHGR